MRAEELTSQLDPTTLVDALADCPEGSTSVEMWHKPCAVTP